MIFHSITELLACIRSNVPPPSTPAFDSALTQVNIAQGIEALFYEEYNCYIIPADPFPQNALYSPASVTQTHYNQFTRNYEDEIVDAIHTYLKTYGSTEINNPDYYGLSALFYAVQNKYFKVSSLLLKYLNPTNDTHLQTLNNALICASSNNDSLIVKLLLQHGAHTDVTDVFGCTPLLYAARFNNKNMIHLLIKYGATIDWETWGVQTKNKPSLSTISYITEQLQKMLLRTLQEKENNMTIEQLLKYIQEAPQTPLQTAINDNSEPDEEDAEYELKKSPKNTPSMTPKPNIKPSYEDFIKQIASLGFDIEEVEVDTSEYEISEADTSGSEISETEEEENNIDLTTPPESEEDVLKAILCYLSKKQYNNCIKKSDDNGYSLLFWAVRKNYLSVAKLLLDIEEVSANIQSKLEEPAIVWAAASNNLPMVQLLLEYNADVDQKNKKNESALTWATRLGNKDMTNYLVIERGATLEDWPTWEAQMEEHPYCTYTRSITKAFLEAAFHAQQQKHSANLPASDPLRCVLETPPSFTPIADKNFQKNTKKTDLSIHTGTDNSDVRISSYIYNTPKH